MRLFVRIGLLAALSGASWGGPMASANFQNHWNVVDAGGSSATSASYTLFNSIFQTGIGTGSSAGYTLLAGFQQRFDTPTGTATPSPSDTPTPSPSPSFSDSPTLTISPTASPSATETPVCGLAGSNVDQAGTGGSANVLIAQQVNIPGGALITAFDVFVKSLGGGNYRLGLYTDAAGAPGNLVVETGSVAYALGLNSFPVSPSYVSAGNYWVVFLRSAGGDYAAGGGANPVHSAVWAFGPMPGAFPASTPAGTSLLGFGAQWCAFVATVTTTPTSSPSFSESPTASPSESVTPTRTISPTATPTPYSCLSMGNFGTNPASTDGATKWVAYKVLAPASGLVGAITARNEFAGAYDLALAIYDHDGANDRPGNLLSDSGGLAPVALAGEYTFGISPPVPVGAGQFYWLAHRGSAWIDVASLSGGLKRSRNGSGAFPAVFGVPSSTDPYTGWIHAQICTFGTTTASPTQTESDTPTFTESPTESATPTASPSDSPTVSPSLTPTPTASPSDSPTTSPSLTLTLTASPSDTPTPTSSPTLSLTLTQTPSDSPSATPSDSPTHSPTSSLTLTFSSSATPSVSPSVTPSDSPTPSPTLSASVTTTLTASPTPTDSPSFTWTPSISPSLTPTPSFTPTLSSSPSESPSHSPTLSATPTHSPTLTSSPSSTPPNSPSFSPTSSPTLSVTPSNTPSPTGSATFTATPTRTPAGALLNGPLEAGSGFVFTGSGAPGDTVEIVRTIGGALGAVSGVVGPNGTFAISSGVTLGAGDRLEARGGTPSGPSLNFIDVVASAGIAASFQTSVDAGALVITVSGNPGDTVFVAADPDGAGLQPVQVFGSALIGPAGAVAVQLSQPLPANETVELLVGGNVDDTVLTSALPGSAPTINAGTVLDSGSTVTGTGVAGRTVQAVASNGQILGTTVVGAGGGFTLALAPVPGGTTVEFIQNGVKNPTPATSRSIGNEPAFTTQNVYRPELGGVLGIGFKPVTDGKVVVKVYNLAGDLIRPVFESGVTAGLLYQANWDGRNGTGETVASGVYFVSVKGAGLKSIRRVVVLK